MRNPSGISFPPNQNLRVTSPASQPARPSGDATGVLVERPLHIITACRARDLPILEITARQLPETVPFRALSVVAPDADCPRIRRKLSPEVRVISESDFIPGIKLDDLRALAVTGFPKMAGWYFQQFIKLQFAFLDQADDYYLIWDADTVPLRPMRFFDSAGRMLLTKADEWHQPYFDTYRRILGTEARREFSFIAQHMIIQKSLAREMLATVEQQVPGAENWAWKIARALSGPSHHLFSEYETYGHYVKNRHPQAVSFVARSWLRKPAQPRGDTVPSRRRLAALAREYDYAAFERVNTGWRRLAMSLLAVLDRVRGWH